MTASGHSAAVVCGVMIASAAGALRESSFMLLEGSVAPGDDLCQRRCRNRRLGLGGHDARNRHCPLTCAASLLRDGASHALEQTGVVARSVKHEDRDVPATPGAVVSDRAAVE